MSLVTVTAAATGLLASPLDAAGAGSTRPLASPTIPYGSPDTSEPSGLAPPGSSQLPGYHLTYVDDFSSSGGLSGWTPFQGATMGDPGGLFTPSHVSVSGGLLRLNAWQDPANGGEWATGGVCQCSVNQTYGAYFVRSRLTGPGATQVEMLMPEDGWPPEIDFNETRQSDLSTTATLHYTSANLQIYRRMSIDMTQWHTWGVIWSPASVTYTVDGRIWATVPQLDAIPNVPMHLDITQQTWCSSNFACPTEPDSTLVNWVAEYQPNASDSAVVGTFAPGSAALSTSTSKSLSELAHRIVQEGDGSVVVIGFNGVGSGGHASSPLGTERAVAAVRQLRSDIAAIGGGPVAVKAASAGQLPPNGLVSSRTSGTSGNFVLLWMT